MGETDGGHRCGGDSDGGHRYQEDADREKDVWKSSGGDLDV